jgi:hypothetical protein
MLVERMGFHHVGASSSCDIPLLRPRYGHGVGTAGRILSEINSAATAFDLRYLHLALACPSCPSSGSSGT